MKKITAVICIFISFVLTGCTEEQHNYVKNIFLFKENDLYKMTVVCYDFVSQEESFTQTEHSSDSIIQLVINAVTEGNYNLRLCEYCFISADLLEESGDIISMLNSVQLPPATNIVGIIDLPEDFAAFDAEKLTDTPLYDITVKQYSTDGIIAVTDSTANNMGLLLLSDSRPALFLDEKQSIVFDMLRNNKIKRNYVFNDGTMSAELQLIDCYYSFPENKVLQISLNILSKDLNGGNNHIQNRQLYLNLLKEEIENDIYQIVNNPVINSVYDFHRYCRQNKSECKGIIIKVNVI